MTRQQFARLKLKAYNNGKRAALRDEKPKLPDCENVSLAELEELLNALSDGQFSGMRVLLNRVKKACPL